MKFIDDVQGDPQPKIFWHSDRAGKLARDGHNYQVQENTNTKIHKHKYKYKWAQLPGAGEWKPFLQRC